MSEVLCLLPLRSLECLGFQRSTEQAHHVAAQDILSTGKAENLHDGTRVV